MKLKKYLLILMNSKIERISDMIDRKHVYFLKVVPIKESCVLNLRYIGERCCLQEIKYDIKMVKCFFKENGIKIKEEYTKKDILDIFNKLQPKRNSLSYEQNSFILLLERLVKDYVNFCKHYVDFRRGECPHRNLQNPICEGIGLLN